MKILLLYPKFPETFWSFKYALPFINKKAAFPPLGLLTIANLLPKEWEKKLVDLNIENLNDKDIQWADFIFISAMVIQKESVEIIIKQAKKLGKKIVAGGPLFTTGFEEFLKDIDPVRNFEKNQKSNEKVDEISNGVDYFVLGEAEVTLPQFISDLKNNKLKRIYKPDSFPEIKETPLPLWELINMKKYASMSIQFSRGCPFNCEFCDIILLNGRFPRAKDKEQIINELNVLYERDWRGNVFFVDDNFIGNKIKADQVKK